LDLLPLLFQLALALQPVQILLDIFRALVLMCMENDVSPAESLLDLDQAQFDARAQLMEPDSHLSVLLLVLVVVGQSNLRPR